MVCHVKSHFQLCNNIVSVLCSGFLASRPSSWTWGSNPHLLHWKFKSQPLDHQGSPRTRVWILILSSCPGVSHLFLCFRGRNNRAWIFNHVEVCSPNSHIYQVWMYFVLYAVIFQATLEYLTHLCVWDFSKVIMGKEINQLCTCFWSKRILEILLWMKDKISCYCWCFQRGDFSVQHVRHTSFSNSKSQTNITYEKEFSCEQELVSPLLKTYIGVDASIIYIYTHIHTHIYITSLYLCIIYII